MIIPSLFPISFVCEGPFPQMPLINRIVYVKMFPNLIGIKNNVVLIGIVLMGRGAAVFVFCVLDRYQSYPQ